MDLVRIVSVVLAALTVGFIVVYLWFQTSARRMDSADVAFCRGLYAAAHTRADSFNADGRIRENQGRQQVASLTCGSLRAAYPDLFASDATR